MAAGGKRRRLQDTGPPIRRIGGERPKPAGQPGGVTRGAVRCGGRRRHEGAILGHHAAGRRGRREIAEIEPERGAERIESGDLATGQGALDRVTEGRAGVQPGRGQGSAAAVHPVAADRHVQYSDRPARRAQVHRALAVHRPVGVDALVVGGRKQPRDQVRVRELIAKQLLHHRQPAGHERSCNRRSPDIGVATDRASVFRPEIGNADLLARRRDAVVGGNTAAVGEVRNGSVFLQGDDGDGVPPQLGDAGHQSRQHLHRDRIDLVADALLGLGRITGISVSVAGSPHEDGLVAGARLCHRRDRRSEMVAQLLLAVTVDDSTEPDAQVQDIGPASTSAPGEDIVEQIPPAVVVSVQSG